MPKKHRMKVTEASSSQYFMKDPAGLLRIVDSQKTIKSELKVDAQRKRPRERQRQRQRHLRFVYLRWLMSDKWKQDQLKGTKRAEGSLIEGARSGHCHLLSSIVHWNGGWSLSLPSWPRIVSIYETNSSPKYRPGSFSSRIFFFRIYLTRVLCQSPPQLSRCPLSCIRILMGSFPGQILSRILICDPDGILTGFLSIGRGNGSRSFVGSLQDSLRWATGKSLRNVCRILFWILCRILTGLFRGRRRSQYSSSFPFVLWCNRGANGKEVRGGYQPTAC